VDDPLATAGYPSGVIQSATPRKTGRAPMVFAVLSILVALGAGGYYYFYRQPQEAANRTQEETVTAFLTAVFTSSDQQQVADLVCASWDPAEAMQRTLAAVPSGARVSWSDVRILTSSGEAANVSAKLGIRLPDDSGPSSFAPWSFTLTYESGWRVCEARPLT
jgi:hypothetical protein